MLPLMNLPINVKRRRTASQETPGSEHERDDASGGPAKKIKITDKDGKEIVVNCEVDKPRCRRCKLSFKTPAALRYHNVMTHPEMEIGRNSSTNTSVTPSTPSSTENSPGTGSPKQRVR